MAAFEPRLSLRCPTDILPAIQEALSTYCPRELFASFDKEPPQTIAFRPKYEWTETPKQVDAFYTSPYVIVYFFTCVDKTAYVETEKAPLAQFVQNYDRPYISLVIVLVNDQVKARNRSGFFSGGGAWQRVQADFGQAQQVTIRANGMVEKAEVAKLWAVFTKGIEGAVTYRIHAMKVALQKGPTIETFGYFLRLNALYEELTLRGRAVELIGRARITLDQNTHLFRSFLGARSLELSFQLTLSDDSLDSAVFQSVPGEFDLQFVFFKHLLNGYITANKICEAIRFSFEFLTRFAPRVKSDPSITPVVYELWISEALLNLTACCSREWETRQSKIAPIFSEILERYCDHLAVLRGLVTEAPAWFGSDAFKHVILLLESPEKCESELVRTYGLLRSVYEFLGHHRRAAATHRKLFPLARDDTKAVHATSASLFAADCFGYLIGNDIFEDIARLSVQEEMPICARLLWDKRSAGLHAKAAARLSTLLQSPDFTFPKHLNLPVYFKFCGMPPITQNAPATISLRFFCRFEGVLLCPQLRIAWWSKEPRSSTTFSAQNFELQDGATLNLSGTFEHPSLYIAHTIAITAQDGGSLRSVLPPNSLVIRVRPAPPPLALAVDLPRFVLPHQWQIALIRLSVVRPISQIDLKISGLTYKPAALRQDNKVVGEGDRLSFAQLLPGEYELYLPVKPRMSGALRIEAQTGGPPIVHEVPFTVSDFLHMKIVCRPTTQIAQLTAKVTSAVLIEISDVTFAGADREKIECKSIGLPVTVGQTDSFALFILDAVPESAVIFVRQRGLRPFSMSLEVKRLEETAPCEDFADSDAPLTPLVPVSFTF
jgi:hypothetical protein